MPMRYTFGRVEVLPDQRLVLVDGQAAELGARAFDLLVCLIESRDRVMGKAELLERVWPGLVVEENNLSVQVSALRKLLGREAVATIPARGYRFSAALSVTDEAVAPTAASNASAPAESVPVAGDERPADLFVGRKTELAQLMAALDSARRGAGRMVLLAGSGGIGKSHLLQRLAWQAQREGAVVGWGRCPEEAGAPPFWAWRQLIRGQLHACSDEQALALLGNGIADIASIAPEVAERFGLQADSAVTTDSQQSRFRLFDAVVGFWRRAARRTPVLLAFEDLHWADASSLRLLAFLAHELADCALLIVGTYRDTELSRQHPLFDTLAELARASGCQRIELRGLSVGETQEFASAISGQAASARLVQALHTRTEGHPLFLVETLRYLLDTQGPQGLGAAGEDAPWLKAIPAGVREVIGQRLNRLSAAAARTLAVAACIGRRFDLALLSDLDADTDEEALLQTLEEAMDEHLIEPMPDAQDFRFSHALIRETLYDEMLPLRRARLHLRIGEALEQRHGTDDPGIWSQLAVHFSEAGAGDAAHKALDYAERAAGHAGKVLAFEEAIRLYDVALQLLQRHAPRDLQRRCRVLQAIGDAQLWHGNVEAANELFRQATALARQTDQADAFARAAIGYANSSTQASRSGEAAVAMLVEAIAGYPANDSVRVELVSRLCVAYIYCDRPAEAMEAHRNAVALARELDDPRSLHMALAAISAAVFWPEMLHERLAATREAWDIAEQLNLRERVSQLMAYFMCDLMHAGDSLQLASVCARGRALATQWRSPFWLAVCQHMEVLMAINEGRLDDAERWAMQALQSGRAVAEDKVVSAFGMQMFCLRREQGRLREALPMLEHFVRTNTEAQTWKPGLALIYAELDMRKACEAEYHSVAWHRVQGRLSDAARTTSVMLLAEVCVYLEDLTRAGQLYDLLSGRAGMALLGDSSGPCLGSADRLLGSLATVMGRWDEAQAHFEAALAADSAAGSRVWVAHGHHRYAWMLQRRARKGDARRALALLEVALAESTALGLQALTPRIRALIDASLTTN
ncbi:AAA family ATPase [uncultured Piscinibacter sp.]|uniref:ATP-binding protein n=1 Tax=uncultured Piscinibacter sp. TaxID=1131835 RepID=UPI00263022BA|nr:AAA family ATPase [uncultured Piscinibacter sp.]